MKGVHIHEKGDCSDIAGKSMGSHFAPEGDKHALPSEEAEDVRHLGDLGNLEVGQDGKGRLEATIAGATLKSGDRMSFLGKALVVHSGQDSGKARQPAGASGTPMGCGVIEST
jgi:Cu-Zn family superoxide dismutase